jgi:alpha-D-ribose 1-methylphosphonate 5-triphosphate diphosphatase PhnM
MRKVQLDDEVFKVAERRASAAGYSSVDKYIADVLIDDADLDTDNLDHLFTPKLVVRLDQISAEIKAGKSVTAEDVDKHLVDVRETWLKDRAG